MQEFWNVPALGENATVKDWTIRILSHAWPLTLKQISERIEQQSGKSVSQQAVFKTLQSLVRQNVVEKNDKQYRLNKDWIQHLVHTAQELQTTYENQAGQIESLTNSKDKTVIEFDDPNAVAVTVAKLVASRTLTNGKPEPYIGIKRHGLWPLRFSFTDFDLLKKMTSSIPCYCAVIGDLPFDRWVVAQYLKAGFKKSKTGVKTEIKEFDLCTQGNYVISIAYSDETIAFIEKLFQHIQNIADLYERFTQEEINKAPFHATLTIERNPDMANMIKEKALKLLEEK